MDRTQMAQLNTLNQKIINGQELTEAQKQVRSQYSKL